MKLTQVCTVTSLIASPPARGRGLKRAFTSDGIFLKVVAPRAGAWIETCLY